MSRRTVRQNWLLHWLQRSAVTTSHSTHCCRYQLSCRLLRWLASWINLTRLHKNTNYNNVSSIAVYCQCCSDVQLQLAVRRLDTPVVIRITFSLKFFDNFSTSSFISQPRETITNHNESRYQTILYRKNRRWCSVKLFVNELSIHTNHPGKDKQYKYITKWQQLQHSKNNTSLWR